jgi:hypothetical protein
MSEMDRPRHRVQVRAFERRRNQRKLLRPAPRPSMAYAAPLWARG